MLSSVLPGFRHVRTPLVTGGLYFFAVWLVTGPGGPGFSLDGQSTAEKRIKLAAESLSPAVVLAACALAATLLGSLVMIQNNPFGIHGRFGQKRQLGESHNWITNEYYNAAFKIVSRAQGLSWNEVNESNVLAPRFFDQDFAPGTSPQAIENWVNENAPFGVEKLDDPINPYQLTQAVMYGVNNEFEPLLTRLKVERESLYDDVDRLRSEAELRYSILLPLCCITLTLCFIWSWWALLAVLLLIGLGRDAYRSEMLADGRVYAALNHGVIESPSLESFKQSFA